MERFVNCTFRELPHGSRPTVAPDPCAAPRVPRNRREESADIFGRSLQSTGDRIGVLFVVAALLAHGIEVTWGELRLALRENLADPLGVPPERVACMRPVLER